MQPTFVQQHTEGTIYNNSLVVECGDRNTYISYTDIYEYDYSDYYTTGSYSESFAGESALTSAIDYVTNEDPAQALHPHRPRRERALQLL